MKKNKKRLFDRKNGRLLRSLDPMTIIMPYIMVQRSANQNLFKDSIDMDLINDYVFKMKSEGFKGFNIMHILVAAYIRTVSEYPGINRFISGYKFYSRNSIEINMAIKKEHSINAPETMIKFFFNPKNTIFDVYSQFDSKINEFKNSENDNSFDNFSRILSKTPRFLLLLIIKTLKFLDYFDLIPLKLLNLSPFHGSLVITSIGSLGIPVIYHHLYNFGNVPMFIAFTATRKENQVQKDGSYKRIRFFDFTITTDDRICDGFYYASALKKLKYYITNPKLLETPPEKVIDDIE